MNRIRFIFLGLFVGFQIILIAQQKPVHTQYMINRYMDNPAYGGMERSLSMFATYRDQYNAIEGNPRSLYIGADMPFYIWNGAVGATVYNQSAGIFDNTQLKGSYNYVMGTPYGFLSFGGRLGIDIMAINGSRVLTPEGDYEGGINHNDPILQNNIFSGIGLTWDLGVYFYGKTIEGGATFSELPSHNFGLGDASFRRTFFGTVFGMYKYEFSRDVKVIPSIMIRYDHINVQSEVGVIGYYQDNLIIGLNLRGYNSNSLDAISMILGTNIGEKYRLIYSYDLGLSSLRSVHDGSHELTLTYNLKKSIGSGLPPKIIYNTRDL